MSQRKFWNLAYLAVFAGFGIAFAVAYILTH
jgi:uncharacterized membrane protein